MPAGINLPLINSFIYLRLIDMNRHLLFLLMGFSLFTSTLQAQHTPAGATSQNEQAQPAVSNQGPAQLSTSLTKVYKSSQPLNEALIASDVKKAQQTALELKKVLSQVDRSLLKDKAHTDWMNYQQAMNSILDKIVSEEKLKVQRKYFAQFSETLYKSVKAFGIDEKAYYQYCPMALDGQGAYWLSESKQIKNPYLGDNMLTCGSTKETLN